MSASSARRVAGAAALIAAITIVARLAGFGRTVVFLRTVGLDCVGNTYQTANTVPNILFEIAAGGALASLVVPLLAPAVSAGERDTAARTASALLSWTVLVLAPLAVLVAVFARPITSLLLGAGGCPGAVDLGARMLLVFAPQVVLYGVGIVLTGLLQSHERFAGPALVPLLSSLTVIVAYLLYRAQAGADPGVGGLSRAAELTLSVGTTAGVVVLSLSLLVPLRRLGVRLGPTLRFPPGAAARARRLAGAGVAVVGAQQVSVAVAVRLANDAGSPATYVVYTTVTTVFLLPWAVLAVPVATSAFPRLAAQHGTGRVDDYRRTTAGAVRAVLVVTLAAAAMLVAAAGPVARMLAQGAGEARDVDALAAGVTAAAPGLVGYGLIALLSRALYARGDARPAVWAQVGGWALVVAADLALAAALPAGDRVVALAAGNAVGCTVAAAALLVALVRRAGGRAVGGVPRTAIVAGLAAAAAAVAGRWLASAWSGGGAAAAVGQAAGVAAVTLLVFAAVAGPVVAADLRRLLRPARVAS